MTDVSTLAPLLEAISRLCRIEFQVRENGKCLYRTTVGFAAPKEAAEDKVLSTLTGTGGPFYTKMQTNGAALHGMPMEGPQASLWLIARLPDPGQDRPQTELTPLLEAIIETFKTRCADQCEINDIASALSQSFEELALYRQLQNLHIDGMHPFSEMPDIFDRLPDILHVDLAFGDFPDCPELNITTYGRQMPDGCSVDSLVRALIRQLSCLDTSAQNPYVMINKSSDDPRFTHMCHRPFRLLACQAAHHGHAHGWIGVVSFDLKNIFKRNDLNMLRAVSSQAAWVVANINLTQGIEALTQRVIDFRRDLSTGSEKNTPEHGAPHPQPFDFLDTAFEELSQKIEMTKTLMVRNDQMATMGQMATVFAHEIKQPLCALDGLIQIAQLTQGTDHPELPIKQMAKAVRNMGRTIKRFESFSKPSRETLKPLSLNTLAREIYHFVKPQLDYKQIAASLDRAPDLPDIVGDTQSLQQVGLNLVTNAIQAMETDNGHPFELQIKTFQESRQACLSIIDNGCGIPDEHNQLVVQPYFTTKPPGKGTGLGLAVVSDIVEQHHGQLEIESAPGKGSRFTIKIPISDHQ